MQKSTLLISALLLASSAFGAKADCLWLAGDALSYGWSLDDATAILSTPEDAALFTGTVYLQGGKDFKFLTTTDFGNEEYGSAPDATLVDGTIAIAKGKGDTGYGKIRVPEDANYLITVNTTAMSATIVKSVYQEKPVNTASLFLVGDATPNGWDVMKGTPLYQNPAEPYVLSNPAIAMTAGSFKIAAELKGACSFDAKYWYFRNADDAAKIARAQDGDLQWSIPEDGNYSVSVNLNTDAIDVDKVVPTAIDSVLAGESAPAEYYTLEGIRVENPGRGIYLRKCGSTVTKLYVK